MVMEKRGSHLGTLNITQAAVVIINQIVLVRNNNK